ncbi:MAG: DUF11 domain-containing protein, partial [Candidatus Electrothrix sp. ATG2]|nr:DUF11 domain-containing protein [Candidatus Electrothrix sp. ATG2]
GFDNNNDGVPDQNAWMQPVGVPGVYDPGCFRLVGTYGLLIVKLSSGGEQLIPFKDQMYFENIPDNTGVVGLVFYEYVALNGVCTGTLTPYQEVASGYLNEKFSGDYGTAFQITTQEPLTSIEKGVSPETAALGSTLTYQMTVTNPAESEHGGLSVTVGDPEIGNPLVVRDTIPSGTKYVLDSAQVVTGSGITDVTILYTYSDGTTTSNKPANQAEADNVVALEWRANTGLVNDSTMTVGFQATVPGDYTEPFVSNIGCAAIGSGPCFDEDDAVTTITGSTSITGTVFEDDGTGSNNGNGTYDTADTGEVGIAGVPVYIYYDADGSGTYSEGDFLWEEVSTDANGEYTSSSTLPAGDWFAVVGDLPASHDGWASTTGTVHTVTTTTGAATAPDTGFAPALTLDKQLVGTPPVNEGDAVTYTIDLNNELYGVPGTGDANSCTRIVWADTLDSTSGAGIVNPSGAIGTDDLYASLPFDTQAESLVVTGFACDTSWGNISSLETLVEVNHDVAYTCNDQKVMITTEGTIGVDGYTHSTPALSSKDVLSASDIPYAGGVLGEDVYAVDVNTVFLPPSVALSDLSTFQVTVSAKKSCGSDPVDTMEVDAVGLRITTDQPCHSDSTIIDPLPLYDTFDANKLEFASATPAPDRLVPYDDGDPTTDMYRIEWDNLGPLNPSETNQVTVNFTAQEPASA